MKRLVAVMLLSVGLVAKGDFATQLTYAEIPVHAKLTFHGDYQGTFSRSVTGYASGATLDDFSWASKGWRIVAEAVDAGYKTPTFWVCPDGPAYTSSGTKYTGDTGYLAGNSWYVYDIQVQPEEYTVSFNPNGGTVTPSSKKVTFDATYGDLPEPERTGYTFGGWWTESSGGSQVTAATKVEITASQTLYAHWTPITYYIRFDANGGGGSMADQAMTYGTSSQLTPNSFNKDNYDFAGWTNTLTCATYSDHQTVNNLTNVQSAVVTLTALWSGKIYTVYYHQNYGSDVTTSDMFAYGGTCALKTGSERWGYDFQGWATSSGDTSPSFAGGEEVNSSSLPFVNGEVHLYAVWKAHMFTVAFDANGGDGGESMDNLSAAVADAANVALPSNKFTNTGCAFAGWALNAAGTGARFGNAEVADLKSVAVKDETVTLYAQWVPYKVTFVVENAAFKPESFESLDVVSQSAQSITVRYTEGRQYVKFPEVTNVNEVLVFSKWCQKRDGVWLDVATNSTVPSLSSGVTNLVAQWGRNDPLAHALDAPALVFSTSNASYPEGVWEPNSDATAEGGNAAFISIPTNNYPTSSGMARVSTSLKGSGTLSFRWKIESAEINSGGKPQYSAWLNTSETLVFQTNGDFVVGIASDSNQHIVTTNNTGSGAGLEDGALGWHTNTVEISAADDAETTVTWAFQYLRFSSTNPASSGCAWIDNVKWTGASSLVIPAHTVLFDGNGGNGTMSAQTVYETGTALAPNEFEFVGYTFAGWNTKADGSGVDFADGAVVSAAEDLTLYAQWAANKYTITFDSAEGTAVPAITQDYGTAIVAPADPTREGYTFAGWQPALPATMPSGNLTVVAQWTVDEYTITFDSAEGSLVPAITQDYGTAVNAPADPTREGYVFAGWQPALPATMPASNLTVVAQWTANEYTITFDSAEGSPVPAITQDCGTAVNAPADPTREGYVFAGWQPALPPTMPPSNLTVVAQWTMTEYTITFDSAEGSAVPAITQVPGTPVNAPADPTREGYTFAGWQPALPQEMPSSNLTVVAQWTATGGNPGGNPGDSQDGDQGGGSTDDAGAGLNGRLYEKVEPALVATASVYDGYIFDAASNVVGILQVKRAKYDAKKDRAKVTASVTMVGGKKVSYAGGEWHEGSASVTLSAKNDPRRLTVVLGVRGMTGTYGTYGVDGSVNSFSSKDPATKADGNAVLKGVMGKGALALAIPSDAGWGGLSVNIKAKGKAKVSGTLADGTRVSVSSQLLIGETSCCLPVVYAKKQTRLAFAIWFTRDGTPTDLMGLEDVKLSSVGGLAAGATFAVDSDAMVAVLGGALQVDYLPNGFTVAQAGSKWIVQDGAKSGKVAEDKGTHEWTVTSENWAALKLSYATKTGLFKGSFKAYLRQSNGKPKAVAVKVSGVVVDGIGYGAATVSKKAAAVMIGAGQAIGGAQ